MQITLETPWFVFDVESVGLYGDAFAVAGGVYAGGSAKPGTEFGFSCPVEHCGGDDEDRLWVQTNVPELVVTHRIPRDVRQGFWHHLQYCLDRFPGIQVAAECGYPVETNFLSRCIKDSLVARKNLAPYPLHDISTLRLAAGFDPLATSDRRPLELPQHNPQADARQSARLLHEALVVLCGGPR